MLISLREIKNRGDVLHFRVKRTRRRGFRKAVESWETDIYHRIGRLSLTLLFPKGRPCRRATVFQRSTSKTIALDAAHFRYQPDGRQRLYWEMLNPRLHDRYVLRWRW